MRSYLWGPEMKENFPKTPQRNFGIHISQFFLTNAATATSSGRKVPDIRVKSRNKAPIHFDSSSLSSATLSVANDANVIRRNPNAVSHNHKVTDGDDHVGEYEEEWDHVEFTVANEVDDGVDVIKVS